MKTFIRVVLLAVIGVPLLLLGSCLGILATGTQDEHWNQRLTLVIETPTGPVSGAVVQRIDWQGTRGLYKSMMSAVDPSSVSIRVTGEALAIEVMPDRWLFALLKGGKGWQGEPGSNAGYAIGAPLGHFARSAEAVAAILDFPKDSPVELGPEAWPMLVTFDDITKPETVREVDPEDMDAAFGCTRTDGINFPWRLAAMTWNDWIESETTRLSRELAAARAGIGEPAATALVETHFIIDDHNYDSADGIRLDVLNDLYSEDQKRSWQKAREKLIGELPATLPTPEKLAGEAGGPCLRIDTAILEITREAVTEGRVVAVLDQHFWHNWQSTRDRALANQLGAGNEPYFSSLPGKLARNDFIQETRP